MSIANIYAGIVKMDDNGDGTLTVYGKATDDSLDIDQQICDPVWLDRAMPEWFTSGGNIREQHSNIAAGIAEEYEKKADGHYITALVVDPVSVKKVKTRVLKGFSIGIKSPRVVRDQKAANGRIVDGQIVEVSLVDRPANPNAKLVLAKSADGEPNLVKTEQLFVKHGDHDQSDHNPHGGGGGSDNSETAGRNDQVASETQADLGVAHSDIEDLHSEMVNSGFSADQIDAAEEAGLLVQDAQSALERAQSADSIETHKDEISSALNSLTEAHSALSEIESGNAGDIQDYLGDMAMTLDNYLSDIDSDYESVITQSVTAEIAKGEKMNKSEEAVSEKPSKESALKRLEMARKRYSKIEAMCKELGYLDEEKQYGETAEEETAEGPSVSPETAQEEVEETQGEKPLEKEMVEPNHMAGKSVNKCLECGCNMPGQSHGNPNVSTAVMVSPDQTPVPTPAIQPPTPKSVGTIVPPSTIEEVGTIIEEEEDSVEENATDKSLLADVNITGIVEKAVKSAIASVEAQVAELKSAKEAVENKASQLESELATAKSLAIGGGPKRTTMATGANTTNEWRAKADLYFAKAASTTDNDLAKGYREMAKDFLAKADSEVKA